MLAFPPDFTFVIQFISFFVLLAVLGRVLFAPFSEVLERRRAATVGAREEAAHAQASAETLASTIERGLEEARVRAAAEADAIRRQARETEAQVFNQAKQEAAATLAQLRSAIAREREQAKGALRQEAKALAAGMVEAVLRPAAGR
jgi:F-type H+-transporting ATPase subunit b